MSFAIVWSNLLLILSSGLSLLIIYNRYSDTPKDFRLAALFIFTLLFFHQALPMTFFEYPQTVKDALFTSFLSVTLITLLIIIRHLKEELNKYPYYIVFSPLMIIVVYPFLLDTYELIGFVNVVIKICSLTVLFLLLITEKNNLKYYYLSLAGLFSIVTGLVIYWISDNHVALNSAWPFLMASGMIIVTFTFPYLLKTNKKHKK